MSGMEQDEAKAAMDSMFSLRRPRDFRAGIASGLKSMAKGVAAGAAGLVAAPAVGAAQEGVKGFAKGLAAGAVQLLGAESTALALVRVGGKLSQPGALISARLGWEAFVASSLPPPI